MTNRAQPQSAGNGHGSSPGFRSAQLGASFYKDANRTAEQARCTRCNGEFMSRMWQSDLTTVERELGFTYELEATGGAMHYQQICPKCRRALFGLAQGAAWAEQAGGVR